jgi:hypothetical protein
MMDSGMMVSNMEWVLILPQMVTKSWENGITEEEYVGLSRAQISHFFKMTPK